MYTYPYITCVLFLLYLLQIVIEIYVHVPYLLL